MIEFPHIEAVYKKDTKGKFIEGKWSFPEFEYLKDNIWLWTEKVNGQNIRMSWIDEKRNIDGRTDEANLRKDLIDYLEHLFPMDILKRHYPKTNICLFGEGYGAGIVKGSGNYIKEGYGFVLFDVIVEGLDGHENKKWWWLKRNNIEDVAKLWTIQAVPIIREGTLTEAIEFTKKGFKSTWGDFQAEGLVARPKTDLLLRNGDRVITKIRTDHFVNANSLRQIG